MKKVIAVMLIVLGMVAVLGCTTTSTLSPEEQAYAKEFFAIVNENHDIFEKSQIENNKAQAKTISQEEFAKYYHTVYFPKIRELRDRALNLNPPDRYTLTHVKLTSAMNGIFKGTEMIDMGFQKNDASYIRQAKPVLNDAGDELILAAEELAEANKR